MASKISALLLGASLVSSPITQSPLAETPAAALSSPREASRRMRCLLGGNYIHPEHARHIDASLPEMNDSNQIVGLYGNILYPQDKERIQQKRLSDWIDACVQGATASFPLSQEEVCEISLYYIERFVFENTSYGFFKEVQEQLDGGMALETALAKAREKTLLRAASYEEIAQKVPDWEGRAKILKEKFLQCGKQIDEIVDQHSQALREKPAVLQEKLAWFSSNLIEAPYTWEMRLKVFEQTINKVLSVSSKSPFFLALQEVTPEALDGLKKSLASRNLQWISFNNLSGKETLLPTQEEVLGEATSFTSTIALSPDLEVLKIELGDLPTESGSVRKILGVRVRNIHNNEVYNLFSTHTDHQIQNDLYARTATKIHAFATQFFQDAPDKTRFVLGGDLNVFENAGGEAYVKQLRELFEGAQDFRETQFYAPKPIAWSSFIGRIDDAFAAGLDRDGTLTPNALDQILVGSGIELKAAAREAAVYNEEGKLLDYYQDREEYLESLRKKITFSDHFFSVVRFQ